MTVLHSLFKHPVAFRRQTAAPLYKERIAFLKYMQENDRKYHTIRAMASHLLQINRVLGFSKRMRMLTMEELKVAARAWAQYTGPLRTKAPGEGSYEVFMRIARAWLRFHNCLQEPKKVRIYEEKLRDFEATLKQRFALAPSTISVCARHTLWFLSWMSQRNIPLRDVSVGHIERYLDMRKAKGWALATLTIASRSLRNFFRHAEGRRWVRPGLSFGTPTYAIPQHRFVPKGPSWKDVQRMIASLDDTRRMDLRDHAMMLLMAVYGLRVGDVVGLLLTDLDFDQRVLTVRRSKNIVTQRFPLNRDTFFTLRRYVSSARPSSSCPALFTTFVAPYMPLRRSTVYTHVRRLFIENRVVSVRRGPHALRHACASRMMKQGHSVAEIAAFLGHADTNTVREYARFDHRALRRIAEFSLEGLL